MTIESSTEANAVPMSRISCPITDRGAHTMTPPHGRLGHGALSTVIGGSEN